ncbi:MAG: type II toxin-antitoxin system VapC family toxin [Oscillospiraceae bacterium]|nr:type II toxin-antitoxin system VapC family toxin [Oscillospiraceae bacterium]
MKKGYILDACALIAYFKKEPGFELVLEYFEKANEEEITLFMHKLNLLEVYYGFYRDDGEETAETMLCDASSLPITFVDDLEEPLFHEAGRLKARYDISFADSFALALASVKGEPLVTCDHHDFGAIEHKEALKFSWIR